MLNSTVNPNRIGLRSPRLRSTHSAESDVFASSTRPRSAGLASDTRLKLVRASGNKRGVYESTASPVKQKWKPSIHVEFTKHSIVLEAGLSLSLIQTTDDTLATLIWTDAVVTIPRLLALAPWQRINHFPGMHFVCHKDYLARTLARMRTVHPDEYKFAPRTWCMRTDMQYFLAHAKKQSGGSGGGKWYIAKPDSKSRGVGIYLFQDPSDYDPHGEFDMVVQEYVDKPFLIDGYKFDLRIYVLITHCDPLRVYIYREGLARFATEPYGQGPAPNNRHRVCMHLTNYSVNKKSTKFVDGGATGGSKRTLTWALNHIESIMGEEGVGVGEKVWQSITRLVAKSLVPIQPELKRQFRSAFPKASQCACFELLGFDVLLDRKLRPYVLEINHSPSLSVETEVDHQIKGPMLRTIFEMVLGKPDSLNPSKWARKSRRDAKKRLYAKPTASATTQDDKDATLAQPTPSSPRKQHQHRARSLDSLDDASSSSSSSSSIYDDQPSNSDPTFEWELAHRGLFEPVLPDPAYARFAESADRLFAVPETAASRARRREIELAAAAATADSRRAHSVTRPVLPPVNSASGGAASGGGGGGQSPPISAREAHERTRARIAQFVAKRREQIALRHGVMAGVPGTVPVAVRTFGSEASLDGGDGGGRGEGGGSWAGIW